MSAVAVVTERTRGGGRAICERQLADGMQAIGADALAQAPRGAVNGGRRRV